MSISMLAVDPGASGGVAWVDHDGVVNALHMPEGMSEQVGLLRSLASQGCAYGVMENVGFFRPGNSGPAACTFARHCGHLEAACYALGIAVTEVTPQSWMKAMGFGVTKYLPDGYKDLPDKDRRAARATAVRLNKTAIKEAMARRYPHIKVTLKTADALAILTWAMGTKGE